MNTSFKFQREFNIGENSDTYFKLNLCMTSLYCTLGFYHYSFFLFLRYSSKGMS